MIIAGGSAIESLWPSGEASTPILSGLIAGLVSIVLGMTFAESNRDIVSRVLLGVELAVAIFCVNLALAFPGCLVSYQFLHPLK